MVDLPSVDIEQKREIAELLVQFFRDEATIARWVKRDRHAILPDLLESEDFVSVVCRWYNDSDVRSFYAEDSATLEWLGLVTSAPLQNLLRPVALECARRWLQSDSPYSYDYEVEFLCAYTDKVRFRTQTSRMDYHDIFNPAREPFIPDIVGTFLELGFQPPPPL